MLDELGDAMDNTDARLTRETQHVIKVTENAKSGGEWPLCALFYDQVTQRPCPTTFAGMCCCIVLLVIAIIAVAAVG